MTKASKAVVALTCALLLASGCLGLRADSRYPEHSSAEVKKALWSPENHPDPGIDLGNVKIKPDVCQGVDTRTALQPLSQDDLSRFLAGQGLSAHVEVKARGNLYWFDFPGTDPDAGDVVRLRLAVLGDANEAADELHKALLEHGPGWWGLRRSNLSILAPKAGVAEALAFAVKFKLVCWGMFMMADADDVYVVPGPYMEL